MWYLMDFQLNVQNKWKMFLFKNYYYINNLLILLLFIQLLLFLFCLIFSCVMFGSIKQNRFHTWSLRDTFTYENLFEFYLLLPFKAKLQNEVVLKRKKMEKYPSAVTPWEAHLYFKKLGKCNNSPSPVEVCLYFLYSSLSGGKCLSVSGLLSPKMHC